jgi:acetylglutamate kinase
VQESLVMLDQGIDAIHIVGIDPPGALLAEASRPGAAGTAFVR